MPKISTDTFVSLVVKHKHRVHGFVAAFFPHRDHIDDVVQNTFLTAWKKMDSFEFAEKSPDTEFCRWVCTIAKFEALAYRRQLVDPKMQFNEKLITEFSNMQLEDDLAQTHKLDLLLDCVAALSQDDKGLIRERYTQGASVLTISENRGVSRQAVSKWFVRIRNALAYCVRQKLAMAGGTDV